MKRLAFLILLVAPSLFAQNNVAVYVTAEMGSTFNGGSIVAQQVIPQGSGTPSLTFFFNSSGNVTMGLPGNGTWQFRFCTPTGLCYNAQGAFPGVPVFDITTIFNNAVSSGGGGGSPAGANGDIQINNAGLFGSGGPGSGHTANVGVLGNIAVKNFLSNAVCYADSTNGSDTNDGLSWGSAKATLRGCIVALPGGSTSPDTQGSGTIYFTDQTRAHPTSGCGVFIMASPDPNYASPPTCWIRQLNGGQSLNFVGVMTASYGEPHLGKAQVLNGGGTNDRNHPGFWASATAGAISWANTTFVGSGREIVIGECSNNSRTGLCNASNMNFENVHGGLNNIVGNGPCIDLTGDSFWIWFKDWSCNGTDTVNSPTADISAAVLIDGRTNFGLGLIHFRDGVTADGGIKMYAGTNILNNVYVENFTTEGTKGEAAVWVAASGQSGDNNVNVFVNNVEVADATTTTAGLEVDVPGSGVSAFNIFGQGPNVIGSAQVMAQYQANLLASTVSPLSQAQVGFFNGHIVGQNSDTDRVFAPTPPRYLNLATTAPSGWLATYGGAVSTLTTGQTAPDGTTGAAVAAYSSGTGSISYVGLYIAGNVPLTLNDYYIWSVWVKSSTANGYNSNQPIQFTLNGDGYGNGDQCNGNTSGTQSLGNQEPYFAGDGEWERIWGLCKVSANPTNGGIVLYAIVNSTQSLAIYAPTLIHIPAGTISNNEAFNIASAMQPYSNTCLVAQLCTPSGPAGIGLSGLTPGVVPAAASSTTISNSSPQLDIGVTHSLGLTFAGTGGLFVPNGPTTTNLTGGPSFVCETAGVLAVCGSSTGTVTHTVGALGSGSRVIGNGGSDIQTINGVLNCASFSGATLDVIWNACNTAAIAAGDWAMDMTSFTGPFNVAAQMNCGDSGGDPIVCLLPSQFTWTTTSAFTGGTSCELFQYSNTYIHGMSPLLKGQFKNGAPTGNMKAEYCNNGGGYYKADNFTIYNPSVTNGSGVAFLVSGSFDNSFFNDIDVADYADGTAGAEFINSCCSTVVTNLTVNGNFTLSAPPLLTLSNGSGTVNGLEFRGGSFDHPAATFPNYQCTDTSTAHNSHIVFSGQMYEEGPNSGTTQNFNVINGCGSVTVNDLELKAEIASSTGAAWSISNTIGTAFQINKLTEILNFTLPGTAVSNSFTGNSASTDAAGNFGPYTSSLETIDSALTMTSYHDVKEISSPANPASGYERWSANSSTHTLTCQTSTGGNCAPGGGTTSTIASGTAALGTTAIGSATCATVVTVAAASVLATDDIMADFNADPTSTVGYIPSASGMLTIIKYPTAGNVNFKVCNNTAGSITPGAVTLNWRVVR